MGNEQTNIQVVDAALTRIVKGDLDGALGVFEDDARWGVAAGLANGGLHDGKAGIRGYLSSIRERFGGDYRMLHLNVYGTPDHVFAELTRTNEDDAYAEGAEHVLLSLHVVMGKIREVREFLYAIH